MKKIILAIAVLLVMAIGMSLYLTHQKSTTGLIRITYTFTGDRNITNAMVTSCIESIDGQDPSWTYIKSTTCGSKSTPCVLEGALKRFSLESKSCEFNIHAPSGMNGNPNPTFIASKGYGVEWALTPDDQVYNDALSLVKIEIGKYGWFWKTIPTGYSSHPWGTNYRADLTL